MPANLTPQYHKAEAEYRRAATAEDELKWLEVMLKEIPKHKGTEKLQSDLKQKIAKARKDVQTEKSAKKGHSVRIPRQGAGTVLVVGGPNAGKSQLVARLTRATPEVAPYPFTTHTPTPGMMEWEDVAVQLVDTPPITVDMMEPYMLGLIRGADLVLLVVDLSSDEGLEAGQAVIERLNGSKTRFAKESYLDEEDLGVSYTQTFLVGNKIDLADAQEQLALFIELCPVDYPVHLISAEHRQGLEELRNAIYHSLDVIRVYTKKPTEKEADYAKPYTIKRGGTLLDVATMIHKDFAEKLKHARIWGHGVHDGTVVKGDHVLHDKDVIELHLA